MTNLIKLYIKNIIKINYLIIIVNLIFAQNIANNNIEKKQDSLNEIEIEIENLENQLNKQIETQKGAIQKLDDIKSKIAIEKEELIKNKNKENYKLDLLKKSNIIIDSLKNNALIINEQKNQTIDLIQIIKLKNNNLTNEISNLNDSLINIKITIDSTLDTLSKVKNKIKNIIQETIIIKPPNDIEFLIETNTWDEFILHSVIYDMLMDENKEKIDNLLTLETEMNVQYKQYLQNQMNLVQSKKKINNDLEQYQNLEIQLNNNINKIENLIIQKEQVYNSIVTEYQKINNNIITTEQRINFLTNEKNEIQQMQKMAADEKKRIEYAIILKKESRKKVENELQKLLLKSSQYTGIDINKYKKKLPWPIKGELITKFGINTSSIGTKFDYTFIELVHNKILYLTNEINPNKPNKDLVQKFQKLTMNLKPGDVGYGVFGPQTTKKWKEYNQTKLNTKIKQPIIAIHNGKIEEIKFVDPIIGVLIIIKHNDKTFSTYSGKIDLIVEKGEEIVMGQKIGLIKSENILAFSLLVNGNLVDPQKWLLDR